jgi:Domain of unknown function (DUF4124)
MRGNNKIADADPCSIATVGTPMLRIACVFLACLACASFLSHAQVYKWIDKDGKVQYSDKPPPEGAGTSAAKKLDTPTPSSSAATASSWQDQELEYKKRRIESAEKKAKEEERERKNQQRCNDARNYLRKLQEVSQVYTRDEKGERQFMSDAEHQAEIVRMQGEISENCR